MRTPERKRNSRLRPRAACAPIVDQYHFAGDKAAMAPRPHPEETRTFTPRRIAALALANVAVIAAVAAIWFAGRAVLMKEIRAKAIQLATVVAQQVDPRLLQRIEDESHLDSEPFRTVLAQLQRVRDSLEDIRFVYAMRHRPDLGPRMWSFIVDADPFDEDADGDGRISDDEKGAPPGLVYDGTALPALERALRGPDADFRFTTDAWGTWMSGYAPILDAQGNPVAVLGVDMPVTEFREKMRIANVAAALALIVLLGMSNLAFIMLFAQRRALAHIRRLDRELQARNAELRAQNETLARTNSTLDETNRELAERESVMAKELQLAQDVQQRFLPREFPFQEQLRCAAMYRACSLIGGDLYDAFPLGEGAAAFFIADVSGHGVSAALVTAIVKVSIERHTAALQEAFSAPPGREEEALRSFLRAMNQAVCGTMREGGFVTFTLAVLRLENGALWFANAGHNPPLLWRRTQARAEYAAIPANLPLGLLPEWEHRIQQMRIERGDKLFLYTDGIPELANGIGQEFGMERLRDTIAAAGQDHPDALLAQVTLATAEFAGTTPPADDMAMLVVEYRE